MSDEIQITHRPFLGEMLNPANIAPVETPASLARPVKAGENSHLLAAVTGQPPLHIVEENETPGRPFGSLRSRVRTADPSPSRSDAWIRPDGYLVVDWELVGTLTKQLPLDDGSQERTRGEFDVATASAGPETEAEERTMAAIQRIVERQATLEAQQRGADHDWSPRKRGHYIQAVFDQAHRYGRLQQFLREPGVEEISIVGHSNVVVTKTDGKKERRPSAANNDDELEQMIAEIASYRGRTFARPGGDIDLDIGGARISGTGRHVTSVTNLSIRKHNHVDIDLQNLVAGRTISTDVARFLAAAVRSNLCIFVAGYPGTGKTTTVRALTSAIPPEEKIVTIETERELYLNKLPDRHWQVQDLEYVPPQAAAADNLAGVSLQKCLDLGLRAGSERFIFAEIKSSEGPIALKAMQAGKGAMSTIHARSADDAIHRFADVLMSELGLSSDTVPLRQILRSIDLILYIDFVYNDDGTRRRVITEVTECRANNNDGGPMAAHLFRYNPDTDSYDTPELPTTDLDRQLRRVGYQFERNRGTR